MALDLLQFLLYYIEEDTNKLHQATKQNKEMKYRVNITVFLSESVKNGAHSIGDSTKKQPKESRKGNGLDRRFCRNQNAPSHSNIADHRKHRVFFEVDRRKYGRHRRKAPNNAKNDPSPSGRNGADRTEQDGGIGSADQKVDGAVIQYLEHLFTHSRV